MSEESNYPIPGKRITLESGRIIWIGKDPLWGFCITIGSFDVEDKLAVNFSLTEEAAVALYQLLGNALYDS